MFRTARLESLINVGFLPHAISLTLFPSVMGKPRAVDGVDLKWVDGSAPPQIPFGTSFGVPWAQGEVDKTTPIALETAGSSIPLQTWPLA